MEQVKPYIKIAYKYTDIDWNVKPKGKFIEHYLPAKECTPDNFPGEEGELLYSQWFGYSMICPDFENSDLEDKTWKLKGSVSSFVIKRGEFVVERCQNITEGPDKHSYCESNENINKFISDLQVDAWVFQEKIDYVKYNTKPIYRIAGIISGDILDPFKVLRNLIYLRKHNIDTEDDTLQIGQKTILDSFY